MRRGPLMYYFGSKVSAAKRYPAPSGTVCEPFAGGAGYSVAWGVQKAILLDLDSRVVALWDFLIHARGDEIRKIPVSLRRGERLSDLPMPPEWRLFLSCRVNTVQWTDTIGAWANCHWNPSIRERVARQVDQIGEWEVHNADYRDAPQTGTTFVDPPYMLQGRAYRHGPDGIDYLHLGEWCQARKGLVIACEQENATWLPWTRTVKLRRACTRKGVAYDEVAYVSTDPPQGR